MKGIIMMLNALGIQISEEQAAAVTSFVATIPQFVEQLGNDIRKSLAYYDAQFQSNDARLLAMEKRLEELCQLMKR